MPEGIGPIESQVKIAKKEDDELAHHPFHRTIILPFDWIKIKRH
jgi:hypothetical protein